MIVKQDIRTLTQEQIRAQLIDLGFEKYRGAQIYEWLWKFGANNFEAMTNVSLKQRELLQEHYHIQTIIPDKIQKSSDGTIKTRFKLDDGGAIESVLIPVPEDGRYTVCVSSQSGCSLTCSFCATGRMGLKRNLTAAEIFDQIFFVNKQCEEQYNSRISNVVYMGMGEPLLNYKQVVESTKLISYPKGFNLSPRRIVVSTAGIAKMIKKLADDDVKFNLALSLHAADDKKRDSIMPINESNNLKALMEALSYFSRKTGFRISYEYIALRDFNDSLEDARNLVKLCSHFPVIVNIIEYNPIANGLFEKSEDDKLNRFAQFVRDKGIMITVRKSRGKDIDAACGQLANQD